MDQLIREIITDIYTQKIHLNVCKLNRYLVDKFYEKGGGGGSDSFVVFSEMVFTSIQNRPKVPVIAKIFVIPPDESYYDDGVYALLYEAKVYTKIINNIIVDKLSPNFIGSFGYGECSVEKTTNFLPERNSDIIYRRLKTGNFNLLLKPKLGIILNPAVPRSRTFKYLYPTVSDNNKINMLFQVIYSLGVMSKFRLIHNDLHANNVLVDDERKEELYAFIIRDKIFSFETKYVPLIFDWDHSYSDYLGENKYLDEKTCLEWNTCNSFKNNFDLAVFLCTLDWMLPDKLDRLRKMYYNKEVEMSYEGDSIPVTGTEVKRLRRYVPISEEDNIYKISRRQLREIFKDKSKKFFEVFLSRTLNALIKLDEVNSEIYLYNSVDCRPTMNLKGTLSPEDILTHTDIFDMLRVDRIPENIPKENIFHFPTKEYVKRRINVDIRVPSTRQKIKGRPRFTKKSMSGYVKQKKDHPHLSEILEKKKKENYYKNFKQNK